MKEHTDQPCDLDMSKGKGTDIMLEEDGHGRKNPKQLPNANQEADPYETETLRKWSSLIRLITFEPESEIAHRTAFCTAVYRYFRMLKQSCKRFLCSQSSLGKS